MKSPPQTPIYHTHLLLKDNLNTPPIIAVSTRVLNTIGDKNTPKGMSFRDENNEAPRFRHADKLGMLRILLECLFYKRMAHFYAHYLFDND